VAKHQRAESHEIAKGRRQPIINSINSETHFRIDWRAGADGLKWYDDPEYNETVRTITPDNIHSPLGLDVILTAPDGQVRWASLFPWTIRDRKQLPSGNYLRTKAPNKGRPKEDEVRRFFGKQWAIIAYMRKLDDTVPLKIACFPFQWFLDRGRFECGVSTMLKGFCFPEHKGRISTVHWFNQCWSYAVSWGYAKNAPGVYATTNSFQTAIATMFQEKKA